VLFNLLQYAVTSLYVVVRGDEGCISPRVHSNMRT